MSDRSSIALLRRIARACRDGGSLEPADAAELAARLELYERRADCGQTLDDVFGLVPAPGGRPWWVTERRRRRDEALRQAAELLCPGGSVAQRAEVLARDIRRYEASAWRWEERKGLPARYRGTARAFIFDALQIGRTPSGRQLRAILAGDELVEVIASQVCESSDVAPVCSSSARTG